MPPRPSSSSPEANADSPAAVPQPVPQAAPQVAPQLDTRATVSEQAPGPDVAANEASPAVQPIYLRSGAKQDSQSADREAKPEAPATESLVDAITINVAQMLVRSLHASVHAAVLSLAPRLVVTLAPDAQSAEAQGEKNALASEEMQDSEAPDSAAQDAATAAAAVEGEASGQA